MEEFRPAIADKLAPTLINRNQITSKDFKIFPGGAVYSTETGRKKVLIEFEKHKQKTITHKFTERKIELGLVPHIQALLLARHLRGDLNTYPPYIRR